MDELSQHRADRQINVKDRRGTMRHINGRAIVSAGFLSVAFVFGAACNKTETTGNAEIWSTYNTTKVMKEKHDYEKFAPKIEVSMAKSEVEGAQLVITPDYDVKSYTLTASDLVSGENVFPAENVRVYKQGYVNVTSKTPNQTNEAYPTGWTPDMLLPMEKAVEYRENTIEKGCNQSLTVEFSSTVSTPAGTYTGTFALDVDGKKTDIPVSVNVWNIDVSKTYGKSCFAYGDFDDNLLPGELSNTAELRAAYYEFLLDNRISPANFPEGSEQLPEAFVEQFLTYKDHPYFNSFGFPIRRGRSAYDVNTESLRQYVEPIVRLCTPGNVYVDMAYYYLVPIDEPSSEAAFNAVDTYRVKIDEMEEKILEALDEDGFFDSFKKDYTEEEIAAFRTTLCESVRNIPQIVTTPYNDTLKDRINTYCPPIQYYNTEYERALYAQNAETTGGEQWFYTCMQPVYPYPSFHIDDYLIGARIQKWMQAAYGVEGYLYWESSSYKNVSQDRLTDPYTDPNRFYYGSQPFPGDGFLTYPGYKYGERGPISSLRLAAYRDGQEDMDMICAFGELLEKYGAYYGTEFSANDVLETLYGEIFTGSVYNSQDAAFYAVRENLAKLYLSAASEGKIVVCSPVINGTHSVTDVYVAAGYNAEINGVAASAEIAGEGKRYRVINDLQQGRTTLRIVVKDEKGNVATEYDMFVSDRLNEANLSQNTVFVSADSSFALTEEGASFSIVSLKEGSLIDLVSFVPYASFSASLFGGFDRIKDIKFTIVNTGEVDLELTVRLAFGESKFDYMQAVISAGESAEITLKNVYDCRWSDLKNADSLRLEFKNRNGKDEPFADRRFTIGKIYYTGVD